MITKSSSSSSSSSSSPLRQPLGEISIADSRFLGFCFSINSPKDAALLQRSLQNEHPDAAHVPVVWWFPPVPNTDDDQVGDSTSSGFDEDGEPPESVGPAIRDEIKKFVTKGTIPETNLRGGVAVVIVRYFGERLLGVTCGRLGQCYRAVVRLTMHRYFFPDVPMELEMEPSDGDNGKNNIYGMGAGDCELILNFVKEGLGNPTDSVNGKTLVQRLLSELKFDGFRGASNEVLPRLQNLQADLSTGVIPIYRYPGNYCGTEWTTFSWSPTSLMLKQAVEERIQPLFHQTMNHCVTNYYRDGKDFIAHHSDKDLDLNRQGVIVSLSLGDERVLELKRRAHPRDVIRVRLPHRSMLVLGPCTNREWTHSILPSEESKQIRLSLTLREVMTFQDLSTGRLFGQGVGNRSLEILRTRACIENTSCFGGFCILSAYMISKKGMSTKTSLLLVGAYTIATNGLRTLSTALDRRREERATREFFSRTSTSGTKY